LLYFGNLCTFAKRKFKIIMTTTAKAIQDVESGNVITCFSYDDYLKRTSLSAEQQSIQRGLDDFQQGKVTSHTQVKKRYESWL